MGQIEPTKEEMKKYGCGDMKATSGDLILPKLADN